MLVGEALGVLHAQANGSEVFFGLLLIVLAGGAQSASDSSVRTRSFSARRHSRTVSGCRAHLSRNKRRACCRTVCLVMPGFEGAG